MSGRGEPTIYEITWKTGHVERIPAHQVSWPNNGARLLEGRDLPDRIDFHAEINGQWTLQLSALMDDIRTIRNCATEEIADAGGAS